MIKMEAKMENLLNRDNTLINVVLEQTSYTEATTKRVNYNNVKHFLK